MNNAEHLTDAEAFEAELDTVPTEKIKPTVYVESSHDPMEQALVARMSARPDAEHTLAQAAYTYLTVHREAVRELAAIAGLIADNVPIKERLLKDGIDPASLTGRLRRRAMLMQESLDETRQLLYNSSEGSGDPILASIAAKSEGRREGQKFELT